MNARARRLERVADRLGNREATAPEAIGASILVVGAGGNIGSHVVPLLGRIDGIGQVTLVDRDIYEPKNLAGQAIVAGDVGKPKALVQVRRLRRVRPSLAARGIPDALENRPLGDFRADLILACLDSREARRRVNEIAWRLGVPWIDAGVAAGGLLARVNAYDPCVDEAACLECGWGMADYAALEQTYPCQGGAAGVAPTNAPASLGALAASLQAIECEKWVRGRADRLAPGTEVLIDAAAHTHYRTTTRRTSACRFDHRRWQIERLERRPGELTLAGALALAGGDPGTPGRPGAVLAIEGQRFVTTLVCAACGHSRPLGRLVAALRLRDCTCTECGHENVPRGFDLVDRLDPAALPPDALGRSLSSFGFRPGEVFSVMRDGTAAYYELARARQGRRQ